MNWKLKQVKKKGQNLTMYKSRANQLTGSPRQLTGLPRGQPRMLR